MNKAKFIKEITVQDPDFDGDVKLSVYKHQNGGIFAIDSSYLDQCIEDDIEYPIIPDPLSDNGNEQKGAKWIMLVDHDL